MRSGAFTLAIWLFDFAIVALFYWKGVLESFLIAASLMIVPTLLVICWEVNNRFLRRVIGLPVFTILTAFFTTGVAVFVNLQQPGLTAIAVFLALEAYLIWRFLLFPKPPPDDSGGDGGSDTPEPLSPESSPAKKPEPGEASFAWRAKHSPSRTTVELN